MNVFALLVYRRPPKLARRIQPKDSPLDRCHVFLDAGRESSGSLHISANRRQAFLKEEFPKILGCRQDNPHIRLLVATQLVKF